jgi:hypothetical protein
MICYFLRLRFEGSATGLFYLELALNYLAEALGALALTLGFSELPPYD